MLKDKIIEIFVPADDFCIPMLATHIVVSCMYARSNHCNKKALTGLFI